VIRRDCLRWARVDRADREGPGWWLWRACWAAEPWRRCWWCAGRRTWAAVTRISTTSPSALAPRHHLDRSRRSPAAANIYVAISSVKVRSHRMRCGDARGAAWHRNATHPVWNSLIHSLRLFYTRMGEGAANPYLDTGWPPLHPSALAEVFSNFFLMARHASTTGVVTV